MRDAQGRSQQVGLLALICSTLLLSPSLVAQTSQPAATKNPIPVINGDLGACSVQFTVTDASGQPVSDAKIRVHIAYGFMSIRKLDLEVGTNTEGKASFEGLPEKVKRPLEFHALQGKREGVAVFDPAKTCKAEHTIVVTQAP
ncbi:MAG TPA: hypothetical protein VJX16_21910 [Terriglobales bacterium]|nr:hypothetical protein [Terriglobales bacterium]